VVDAVEGRRWRDPADAMIRHPTPPRRARDLARFFRDRRAAGAGPRPGPERPSRPYRAGRPPPRPSPQGIEPAGTCVRSDEMARLEAALFLSREPLSTRKLAKLARLADGTRARTLLRDLAALQDAAGSAFRVESIAGGYQLLTRASFGPWVRRILTSPAENRLSAAAMETLAIVAYRQPVTRAEVESIRGVGCEEMLRQLMERDLVAVGGRSEDIGRPNVYQTTQRFLRAFGLSRIEDLPPIGPPVDADRGVATGTPPGDPPA